MESNKNKSRMFALISVDINHLMRGSSSMSAIDAQFDFAKRDLVAAIGEKIKASRKFKSECRKCPGISKKEHTRDLESQKRFIWTTSGSFHLQCKYFQGFNIECPKGLNSCRDKGGPKASPRLQNTEDHQTHVRAHIAAHKRLHAVAARHRRRP